MNIKAVVKVMNFHALLRVDNSTKQANKYTRVAEELEAMMRIILNNKNLRTDKKILTPDTTKPALKIYIGSDFGFCGNVNSSVVSKINQDPKSDKIIVGKKIKKTNSNLLYIEQEKLNNKFSEVKKILSEAVRERSWSEIYICYNHFYNLSKIQQIEKKIYPLEPLKDGQEKKLSWTNFAIEGDVSNLLEEMIISYLSYQVKIAQASAFAAENTIRQNATTESLKKLDEMEIETTKHERKEKTQKSFQKTIDSYVKQKSLKGL